MHALFIILCLFLQAVPTNRQLTERMDLLQNQIQAQQQAVSELAGSQQLTDKALDQLSTLVETTNSSINNTLSVTNIVIALAALIVAVAAILLGGYISRMERKIKTMSDEVTAKETEVKKLSTDINNNIDGLFERIRREDTKAYLKRLLEVPRDIANLGEILFTRQLIEEDFKTLKDAYLKLKRNKEDGKDCDGMTYGEMYLSLFFQHFPGRALQDTELHEEIIFFFDYGVGAAFSNDIEKEVKEIGTVVSDKNVLTDRENILLLLRKAIAKSDYKNDETVLKLLKDSVNDEELWERVDNSLTDSTKAKKG